MKSKRTGEILTVLLFGLLLVLALVSYVEGRSKNSTVAAQYTPNKTTIQMVINHSVHNGVSEYSGDVPMKNDCDSLHTGIINGGGTPSHIQIVLGVVTDNNCTAQPDTYTQPFSVAISASSTQDVVLDQVLFNNQPVAYNISEVK
jgi:hypothetical protein